MSTSNRKPVIKEIVSSTIPGKINKKDLKQGNGYLVAKDEVAKIERLIEEGKLDIGGGIRLTKGMLKGYSPPITSDYSIVVTPKADGGHRIIAVYKGEKKALGEGSFGKVKLAQDLNSGEFLAVKIQKSVTEKQQKKQTDEVDILKKIDPVASIFQYTPTGKNVKKYTQVVNAGDAKNPIPEKKTGASMTIMSLAPGKPLSDQIDELTPFERNQVAIQLIEAVHSLHEKGVLHLDIKLENFMYDKKTKKLSMIDFGTSIEFDPATGSAEASFRGSPFYMPSEIKVFFDNMNDLSKAQSDTFVRVEGEGGLGGTILRYNKEVDTYGLGIALGELYKLAERPSWSGKGFMEPASIATKGSDLYRENDTVQDKRSRDMITQFLQQMTDETNSKRPSLTESQAFFQSVAKRHGPCKVGIIDATEFNDAGMKGQLHFEQAMLAFDEVILLAPGRNMNADEAKEALEDLKDALEGENTTIRYELYEGDDLAHLASGISEFDHQHGGTPSAYYFLTETSLEQSPVASAQITSLKLEVDQSIDPDNFTPDQKEAVRNQVDVMITASKRDHSLKSLGGSAKKSPAVDLDTPSPRNKL